MITVRSAQRVLRKSQAQETRYLVRFAAKSEDTKPVDWYDSVGYISNGSTLVEVDTGKHYMYDQAEQEWIQLGAPSGGGGNEGGDSGDIITPEDADEIFDNAENQQGQDSGVPFNSSTPTFEETEEGSF